MMKIETALGEIVIGTAKAGAQAMLIALSLRYLALARRKLRKRRNAA